MAGKAGRPRRFKTPQDLTDAWEAYKVYCDNKRVTRTDFNGKTGEYHEKEIRKVNSYTIVGFCAFSKINRDAFYRNYVDKPQYKDIATLIREACEVDAYEKYELGLIDSRLAPLFMSRYGYKANVDANLTAGPVPVVLNNDLKPDEG